MPKKITSKIAKLKHKLFTKKQSPGINQSKYKIITGTTANKKQNPKPTKILKKF